MPICFAECLQRGAARFGWANRTAAPGSMRGDDGTLIGWGVACGIYKTATVAAIAKLRVRGDGKVHVSALPWRC